jgi:hypothetical protein
MSVWKCPHCTSVQIVIGDRPFGESGGVALRAVSQKCPRADCGGIMTELDEPEACIAVRAALYGHDHGFSPVPSSEIDPRLATAAPELLAAVRLLMKRHHQLFSEDTLQRVQAAIVKATGRPSDAGKAAS